MDAKTLTRVQLTLSLAAAVYFGIAAIGGSMFSVVLVFYAGGVFGASISQLAKDPQP